MADSEQRVLASSQFFVDMMILRFVQLFAGVLNQKVCYGHLRLSPDQH